MPIIESHLRPKEERRSKRIWNGKRAKVRDYQYVEDLLNLIICDIVNGVQKSDIMSKLQEQLYDGQKQKYTWKTAEMYYYTAMHRLKEDRESDIENLKDKLYSQYYQLYNDSMLVGNTLVAKSVLDSIVKTFLPDEKNIKVDANINGELTIDFNFDNNEGEL